MATTTTTSTTASTTPTTTPRMRAALVSLPPCPPVVTTIDVVVTGNELVAIDSPISYNISLTTTPVDIVTTVVVIAIMVAVFRAGEDDKLPKEEPVLSTELVASNGCGLVLILGFWLVEEEEAEESSGGTDVVLGQHSTTG